MSSDLRERVGRLVLRLLDDPAWTVAALGLASALLLGGALLSQYVGGLQPCILCLYQRVPYAAAVGLAIYALPLRAALGRRGLAATVGMLGALFLADAALALFHVGVEQHWWAGTATCGSLPLGPLGVEALRELLLATPVVRCDEPAWVLFGVSMAGYNMLAALTLAAAATGIAWRQLRAS